MTFRDDHDALFERAESLEREVEALRRENEALRRENEELRRENEALRAARRPEAVPVPVLVPLGEGENPDRIRRALAAWWFPVLHIAMYPLSLVAFAGMLVLFGKRWGGGGMVVAVWGTILGYPLAYFGLLHVVRSLEVRAERRWLARVTVPFDHAAYVWGLGSQHDRRTVRLTLAFSRMLTREERETVLAIARGSRRVEASWRGDELVLASPSLKTAWRVKAKVVHDNVRVHRWFRATVRRAVARIAETIPVARMSVSG